MTQYLLSVWHDRDATPEDIYPSGGDPGGVRRDRRVQRGAAGERLLGVRRWSAPPTTATVVDGTGAEVVTTDGPFSESKEQIGGFWVVEAPDLDAALDIAARGSASPGQGRGPPLPGRVSDRRRTAAGRGGLPCRVRHGGRLPHRPVRRPRPRRGDGPGGLRRGASPLAHRGRAAQPRGWLTVTARNRALDRLRRESTRQARHEEAEMLSAPEDPAAPRDVGHRRAAAAPLHVLPPGARPEAQVALTLRLLGGLTVPEVAAAFLVPERTMAQRITRAKRKIAAATSPTACPATRAARPPRGVLAVVYLVFTEGHLPGSGDDRHP